MINKNKFLKDGIILLDKSKGISSFGAINELKWLLNCSKVGHGGTLDPMAEGLLIVMVNGATKFSEDLMKKNKEYYVEMKLGYETDTYDAEGVETKRFEGKILLTEGEIFKEINSFLGEIDQVPPMYSAIKVNGEKLYNLARKGVEIERKARKVKINYINDLKYDVKNNRISFVVGVSSGTYIRSLVRDIGENLGVYGTMTKLVRTKIDCFSLENSVKLENISEKLEKDRISEESTITEKEKTEIVKFQNIEKIFDYSKLEIKEENYKKLKNGMTVVLESKEIVGENINNVKVNDKFKVYLEKNEFVGIVFVVKVFNDKIFIKRGKYFL